MGKAHGYVDGEYYVSTNNLSGKTVRIKMRDTDKVVRGELRRLLTLYMSGYSIIDISKNNIRITPSGRLYKAGKEVTAFIKKGMYDVQLGNITTRIAVSTMINREFREMDGAYEFRTDRDVAYGRWRAITDKNRLKNRNCNVHPDWKDFDTFYKWWQCNIYKLKGEQGYRKLHIDKDILGKDKRLYGPDTCLIVPYYINESFGKYRSIREEDNNDSVIEDSSKGKYNWVCRLYGHKTMAELNKHILDDNDTSVNGRKRDRLINELLPRFIDDIHPDYKNNPMVLKVIDTLVNYKFE